MIVRGSLTVSASQSRLFCCNKCQFFKVLVHFGTNQFADLTFAFSAVKIAAVFLHDVLRAAGTRVDGGSDFSLIDVVANANDHENYLRQSANECQVLYCHDSMSNLLRRGA